MKLFALVFLLIFSLSESVFAAATSVVNTQKNGSIVGLDVRTEEEVEENPAPGSVNIPIMDLNGRSDELDKDKTIFVFCESGGRAEKARNLLNSKGFNKVKNIKDWRAWNQLKKDK